MTEPKSPREIAEAIADKWCHTESDIEYTAELASQIEQALLSCAAERESAFEDLQADYGNDLGYLKALKESARQLRDLFAKHGVDKHLNWPEWFAAIESRLSSRPATEGKSD